MEFSGAFPPTSTSALAVFTNPGVMPVPGTDKFLEGRGCLGHTCFSGWSLVLDPRQVPDLETFEVVEEEVVVAGEILAEKAEKGALGKAHVETHADRTA